MGERADVAVVGGGLAGAAAAIRLARAGAHVVLLEKETAPGPKVCGEFLSVVALAELEALGISAAALGAVPLSRARMSAGRQTAGTDLPFRAASLTRDRLDAALLSAAEAAGADVRRGVRVRALDSSSGAASLETTCGTVDAASVLLACGKTDMPGRRRSGGLHVSLVGLKRRAVLRADAQRMLGDASELALFPGGYCGIQPVEDGTANVCLVIEADALKETGPKGAFAAAARGGERAAALLDGARWQGERPMAIGYLPYGFVRTATDGAFHLGDQAVVIPSFCGEGMALALASARLAAEAILAGESAAAFQRRFARIAGTRVRGAAVLSRALCALPFQRLAVTVAPATPPLIRRIAAVTRTPAPLPAR